ncbi:MAG: DUF3106 domain-containing protein [Puniceicoccaceae bacterium]|nr:DUF3106 domain-containing protein [Puniceicoccaceae bacterium]
MKTPLTVIVLALLCALPLWANPPKDSKGLPEGSQGETRMLQQLLKMKPADLTDLRQTIERIEQMTSEEKEKLRKRVGELNQMRPERVKAMRERFESIPRERREAMRQRWLELPPEERQEWHQKLHAMSPEQRQEVLDEQGFLPTPGKAYKGKKPPRPPEE